MQGDTYQWTKGRAAAVATVAAKKKLVNKEDRKWFGRQISHRRKELDLTQMELAELTNQKYFTFVSNVENGAAKIPTHDLRTWAKALKVDLATFAKSHVYACDRQLYEALFGKVTPKAFKRI